MLIYSISNEKELSNIPKWAEWLELRIDLSSSLLNHIIELSAYKVIITDRRNREGGKDDKTLEEKLKLFNSLACHQNLYFDLEIDLLDANTEMTIDYRRVILSFHNFGTIEIPDLHAKLIKARTLNPYFIKIAQYCSTFKEVNDLYYISEQFQEKILWLVMGEYGKLQRLLYPYLNSLGTFIVADGRDTVRGQLNLSDVEKYQHFLYSKPFKWGGLIGSKQVYSSLGIEFYNNYFRKNNIDACYLPISLKSSDLKDFFALIETNEDLKQNCYGFSLTMPFKQIIPNLFNFNQISNLLIYGREPKFYNSDYDAFIRIKNKLASLPIKSILIYGTGSMAEIALEVFADYQIYLAGRNKSRLLELRSKRKKIEIIDQITPEIYIDLLINTSSLGMKGESFSRETGISKFRFVIDLPYSQDEIPLQQEVEKERYFSGREFWLYQSERQLQLFKERIENDKKQSFTK